MFLHNSTLNLISDILLLLIALTPLIITTFPDIIFGKEETWNRFYKLTPISPNEERVEFYKVNSDYSSYFLDTEGNWRVLKVNDTSHVYFTEFFEKEGETIYPFYGRRGYRVELTNEKDIKEYLMLLELSR